MALTASYTAVSTIARWIDPTGGVWPAPAGTAVAGLKIAVMACSFHWRSMLADSPPAEAVAKGKVPARTSPAVTETRATRVRALEKRSGRCIPPLLLCGAARVRELDARGRAI